MNHSKCILKIDCLRKAGLMSIDFRSQTMYKNKPKGTPYFSITIFILNPYSVCWWRQTVDSVISEVPALLHISPVLHLSSRRLMGTLGEFSLILGYFHLSTMTLGKMYIISLFPIISPCVSPLYLLSQSHEFCTPLGVQKNFVSMSWHQG